MWRTTTWHCSWWLLHCACMILTAAHKCKCAQHIASCSFQVALFCFVRSGTHVHAHARSGTIQVVLRDEETLEVEEADATIPLTVVWLGLGPVWQGSPEAASSVRPCPSQVWQLPYGHAAQLVCTSTGRAACRRGWHAFLTRTTHHRHLPCVFVEHCGSEGHFTSLERWWLVRSQRGMEPLEPAACVLGEGSKTCKEPLVRSSHAACGPKPPSLYSSLFNRLRWDRNDPRVHALICGAWLVSILARACMRGAVVPSKVVLSSERTPEQASMTLMARTVHLQTAKAVAG